MPGKHVKMYLFGCFKDVGGSDLWHVHHFDDDRQQSWWVGWHSPKPPCAWWETLPTEWIQIGWELWAYDGRCLETWHFQPNASIQPQGWVPDNDEHEWVLVSKHPNSHGHFGFHAWKHASEVVAVAYDVINTDFGNIKGYSKGTRSTGGKRKPMAKPEGVPKCRPKATPDKASPKAPMVVKERSSL